MAFQGKSASPSGSSSDATTSLAERTQQMRRGYSRDELAQVDTTAAKVLKSTTRSKSYFRERDLSRRILERCQKDFPAELVERDGFAKLIDNVVENMPFITIGDTGYVTTQEVAEREKMMLTLAGFQTSDHVLNKRVVEHAIRARRGISEEQVRAVEAACLSDRRVTVIEGTAGAGKSFTMQAIKEAFRQSGYHVVGTALGWSPAKVLEESTGLDNCVALDGLIRQMKKARAGGTEYFRQPTLLIVDEAGMVGTAHMRDLLEETHHAKHPVKVVLTGDSLQLNPVDAGSALEVIVEFHGTTRIDTIRRQQKASHRLAVKRFSQRQAGAALYPFVQQEAIRWCEHADARFDMVVRDFLSYKQAFPDKKALILALTNKDVVELNQRVRKIYKKLGLVRGREVELEVTDGRTKWEASFAEGDEVVVRANSKEMQVYEIPTNPKHLDVTTFKPLRTGVFNRNTGRVVAIERSKDPVGSFDMHIDLEGGRPGRVVLNSQTFRAQDIFGFPVVHNFATTIYASQGQTVNKVFLLDHPRMNFRLAYVGMSRHTDSVDVYLDETELHQRMDKMRGVATPTSVKLAARDGQAPEVIPVTLGRYRRGEMLQTVALHWAKDDKNLTVVMLDRESRLGRKSQEDVPPDEELARLAPLSSEDPLTDFDPPVIEVRAGDTLDQLAEREEVDAEALDLWKANLRRWNGLAADTTTIDQDGRLFLGERTNINPPLIDVEKLLDMSERIAETDLVKPSDVEQNNRDLPWTEMPLKGAPAPAATPGTERPAVADVPVTPPAPTSSPTASAAPDAVPSATAPVEPEPTASGGLFSAAWRLLSGKKAPAPRTAYGPLPSEPPQPEAPQPVPMPPIPEPTPAPQDLQDATIDPPFATEDAPVPSAAATPETPEGPGVVKTLVDHLRQAFTPRSGPAVPFLETPSQPGFLDPMGLLRFVAEPQGVSDHMLGLTREHYWGVGRGNEPRIYARDPRGGIIARYALDGRCVVGEGYPPMLLNTRGGAGAPIMIVPGAKEWLWAHEHNQARLGKPDADPTSVPHIVWGARDVEWRWVAQAMRTKKVTIARSKTDEAQIPWAVELQKQLWDNWGVTADIRPRPPGLTAPWESPADMTAPAPSVAPASSPEAPAASPAVNRPPVFKRR